MSAIFFTNAAVTSIEERKSRGTPLELLAQPERNSGELKQTSGSENHPLNTTSKAPIEKMADTQVEALPKPQGKRSSFKLKPTSSKVAVTQPAKSQGPVPKISKSAEDQYHVIDFDASAVTPLPFNTSNGGAPDSVFHILVLGSFGSGATSLAARFIGQRIADGRGMRVFKHGDHYVPVSIQVAHTPNELDEKTIRRACGAVIVCDSASAVPSVRAASQWKKELDTARKVLGLPSLCTVLAATKFDGASKNTLADKEITELASVEGADFDRVFSASALTGLNVDNAFDAVISQASLKFPQLAAAPAIVKIQPITISVEGNPVNSTGGESGKCVIS